MSTYAEMALYIYGFAVKCPFHDLESLEYYHDDPVLTPLSFQLLRGLLSVPGVVCIETGDHDYTFVGFPVELVTPNDAVGTWTNERRQNGTRRQMIDEVSRVVNEKNPESIKEPLGVHYVCSDSEEAICDSNYLSLRLSRPLPDRRLFSRSVGIWLDGPNRAFNAISAEEHEELDEQIDPNSEYPEQEQTVKDLCQL